MCIVWQNYSNLCIRRRTSASMLKYAKQCNGEICKKKLKYAKKCERLFKVCNSLTIYKRIQKYFKLCKITLK